LISDAIASGSREHYKTTTERIRDYYGVIMDFEQFAIACRPAQENNGHVSKDRVEAFIQEFNLLDPMASVA
jgi:hypothetical protein